MPTATTSKPTTRRRRPTKKKGTLRSRPFLQWLKPEQVKEDHFFLQVNVAFGVSIIVGWILLFCEGVSASQLNFGVAFTYRWMAPLTIGLITLLMVVWPIIRIFSKRSKIRTKKQPLKEIILVPIVLFFLPVPMGLATLFLMETFPGMAVYLWQPRLLGVIALGLNAILVFAIGAVASDNPKIRQSKKTAEDADGVVKSLSTAKTANNHLYDTLIEEQTTAKTVHENAAEVAEAASRSFEKAELADKTNPLKTALDVAEKALKDAEDNEVTIQNRISESEEALSKAKKAKSPSATAEHTAALKDLRAELAANTKLITLCRSNLKYAEAKYAASPTGRKLIDAEAANNDASAEEAKAKKALGKIQKSIDRNREEQNRINTTLKEKRAAARAATTQSDELIASEDSGFKRYWWVIAILFVVTVFFYTAWLGWVIESAHLHV